MLYRSAHYVQQHFETPVIVNIGVSWGASLHCLRAGAPRARLIGVDVDFETRPVRRKDLLRDVEFVQADSTQYRMEGPAHLVFVDGGHDYRTVQGDIANWTPRIPAGGILIFHDYAPSARDARRLAGVRQAVDEWRNEKWEETDQAKSVVAFRRLA